MTTRGKLSMSIMVAVIATGTLVFANQQSRHFVNIRDLPYDQILVDLDQ